jgi:dihydroxyacetone kinase
MGLLIEMVLVADDVALRAPTSAATADASTSRARGVAGTLLVHKLAGYLSEELRWPLARLTSAVREFAAEVRTLAVALRGCRMPGQVGGQPPLLVRH